MLVSNSIPLKTWPPMITKLWKLTLKVSKISDALQKNKEGAEKEVWKNLTISCELNFEQIDDTTSIDPIEKIKEIWYYLDANLCK